MYEHKSYEEMCELIEEFGSDTVQYIAFMKLTHWFGSEPRLRRGSFNTNTTFYGLNDYSHSELSVMYVNNESTFYKSNIRVIIDRDNVPYRWTTVLNKLIDNIVDIKSLRPIVVGSIVQPEEWGAVISKLKYCDDGVQLSQILQMLKKYNSCSDGSFVPESYADIIGPTIRVDLLQHDTNMGTVDDVGYIRVYATIIKYNYSYRDMIQYIKKFKKDIDRVIIRKIKERLKDTGLSINFFKLSNCTFRRDYILEYTFSLKDIITKEDN